MTVYETAANILWIFGLNTPPLFEQICNYVLTDKYSDLPLSINDIPYYGDTLISLGINDTVSLEKVGQIALTDDVDLLHA